MPIKVITDHKSLKYFITIKKLIRCQAHWAEFLSGFNFVISYILSKKNHKPDLLICRPNNLLLSENDDCQQHSLEMLLPTKRLEISSITKEENTIIIEQIVKANLKDYYSSKLLHLLETDDPVEGIDLHHFFHLLVNSKNCIYQYD